MKMIFLYGFVVATVGGALVEASYHEGDEQVSISDGFSFVFFFFKLCCTYVIFPRSYVLVFVIVCIFLSGRSSEGLRIAVVAGKSHRPAAVERWRLGWILSQNWIRVSVLRHGDD